MKLQDLVHARLSIPEPIVGFCQLEDCRKPVSVVVTVTFADLAPRRVCLCANCHQRIVVEQSPPSKPVGQWPTPPVTFKAEKGKP